MIRRRLLPLLGVIVCGAALPLRAQEGPERKVRVTLELLSAGGESLRGGQVRITPWDGSAKRLLMIPDDGSAPDVWLEAGRRYELEILSPSHEMTKITVHTDATDLSVRVVLPIDPYVLPELAPAALRDGSRLRIGAVSAIQFAQEPLIYGTVGEWMRDQPGVIVRGRGPGGRQVVTVRGSRPEDVLVLLDGASLNDAVTGSADLSLIPTATLESATLLRGTGSHRYGSGASAGVLLLVSRVSAGTEAGAGMRLESFGGLGMDAHAGIAGRRGRLGLSLSTSRGTNDFRYTNRVLPGSPVESRTNADASAVNAAATGSLGIARMSLRYDGSERGVPGRMGTTVFDGARAEDRSWVAGVGVDGSGASVAGSFRASRFGYRRDETAETETQRVQELRLTGELPEPGSVPVTLAGRVTHEMVSGDGIGGTPRRTVAGLQASATLQSGRVRLEPALAVDVSGDRRAVSPELGVTWLGSGRWRTWLRVGQGFRLPSFGDLYFASAYQVRPNPDLKSERVSLDAELGGTADAQVDGVDVRVGATAWYRLTEDPIVWLASAVAVWSPRNLDRLESRGVEADIELAGRAPADLHWRVQMSGSVQSSRVGFGSNRNRLPYQPPVSGRVSASVSRRGTGVRVDARHTGARATSVAGTRDLPPFTTLDVSVTQSLRVTGLSLGLLGRMENVLDRRYEMIELFPEPGRRLILRLEARGARR